MGLYYTYLIKCEPVNQFYYGVRYAKDAHPSQLWKTYFTSSKKIKELRKTYGDASFSFEIRRTFTSPEKAIEWEKKVHRRLKVLQRQDFLNCQEGNSFKVPTEKFRKRRSEVCASSRWMIKDNKERFVSISDQEKMQKLGWTFGRADTIFSKIAKKRRSYKGEGNPLYGKKRADLTAYNKIPKVWITNGKENHQIPKDKFDEYVSKGFYRGRPTL